MKHSLQSNNKKQYINYNLLQINNIELRSDGCGGFLRHPDAHVVWFALERGSTSSCKDLRSFCDSHEVRGICYKCVTILSFDFISDLFSEHLATIFPPILDHQASGFKAHFSSVLQILVHQSSCFSESFKKHVGVCYWLIAH